MFAEYITTENSVADPTSTKQDPFLDCILGAMQSHAALELGRASQPSNRNFGLDYDAIVIFNCPPFDTDRRLKCSRPVGKKLIDTGLGWMAKAPVVGKIVPLATDESILVGM